MRTLGLSRAGLAVSVVLGACATAPPQRDSSNPERLCIDRRDINTIRALDDHHVFVKVSAARFFLLTVERTCAELRLARSIAIVESTSRICGDGHSMISFTDPTVGVMRCRIEAIDSVPDQSAAMDLIESRREP